MGYSMGGTTTRLWRQVPQRDPFPKPDPKPAPNCAVCAALAKQRTEYYRFRDFSGVVDCNVEIRQHPHGQAAR